jgi:hypothetical protein
MGAFVLYVGLGIIYIFLLVYLGVKTAKNRRWVLFALGFLIPVLWIIGGILPPRGMSRMDSLYEQRERSS